MAIMEKISEIKQVVGEIHNELYERTYSEDSWVDEILTKTDYLLEQIENVEKECIKVTVYSDKPTVEAVRSHFFPIIGVLKEKIASADKSAVMGIIEEMDKYYRGIAERKQFEVADFFYDEILSKSLDMIPFATAKAIYDDSRYSNTIYSYFEM